MSCSSSVVESGILGEMKMTRIRWAGRLQRMAEERMHKRVFQGRRGEKEDQRKGGWTVFRRTSEDLVSIITDKVFNGRQKGKKLMPTFALLW